MTEIALPMSNAITPAAHQRPSLSDEIQMFELDWRSAKYLSMSRVIPQHFQGKTEDCMVACMMARQLGVHPFHMLQALHFINGRTGYSASFAIAMANTRGPFAGPINWETKGKGDQLEVTAYAIVKATGDRVSATTSMAMATAEGWTKNPKYRSIPEHMLKLRAATWLIRTTCPEVLFGLSTDEEIETMTVRSVEPPETKQTKRQQPAPTGDMVGELNAAIRQATVVPDVDEIRTTLFATEESGTNDGENLF